MTSTKGTHKRKIITPDYHIEAKFDLRGLRLRNKMNESKESHFELPLTSMIDMFSMLVIFLILNFSSTGEIFFISKEVTLPTTKHSHPLESKPLISIANNKVSFDSKNVGDNPLHVVEVDQMNMPNLRRALKQVKAFHMSIKPNEEFKGEVNIQADEKTSIVYIKRVMNTLISEGWSGIHFATRLDEN